MSLTSTTSVRRHDVHGNQRVTVTDIVPNAYVTGGLAVTAAQLGLTRVEFGVASVVTNVSTAAAAVGSAAVLPQTDGSVKLKCNLAAGGEVTSAEALTGTTIRVVAFGQ